MKINNYKNYKVVKVDLETHRITMELSRYATAIENKSVAMGEILKRAIKKEEIKDRIKLGSKERSLGLR